MNSLGTQGSSAPPNQLRALITAIFETWQRNSIEFVVLRNYKDLPDSTDNDIDVLVRKSSQEIAELLMVEAATSHGFRRHNRVEFATLANYFYHPASGAQLHVDLFPDLKWNGFDFANSEAILNERNSRGLFSIPHPAHEAAVNLLATLIYNGSIKEKYRSSISKGFSDEPVKAKQLLSATYGVNLASFTVEYGGRGEWTTLEQSAGSLRQALIIRQLLRRPFSVLLSLVANARRFLQRWLRPPGLALVFCGADGSGKTTVAASVIDQVRITFAAPKVRQFHWKPAVFSGRRMSARAPVTRPHDQRPRNALVSFLYFSVHWLEFFLGEIFRIRPITFKNGLVLIDRWYYDFFIDQRRYRLRVPRLLVRVGYAFLCKPDLVFILDAPPEILHARKQELPPAETQRQRDGFLDLARSLPQARIIDANRPLDEVVKAVKMAILDFMAERNRF